jgi:hypothetical protein
MSMVMSSDWGAQRQKERSWFMTAAMVSAGESLAKEEISSSSLAAE